MSTFALIHGGGGTSWDWHLVSSELREHGHEPVAVDLPSEDDSAGWWEYADTVVKAGRANEIPPLPGRPHVPRALGAPPRP